MSQFEQPNPQPQYMPPPPPKKQSSMKMVLIVFAVMGVAGICFCGMLAAIAVPNFLEAQVRAKVSRTRAEMRSMATALEAYYVDNRSYPPSAIMSEPSMSGFAGPALTTPIPYLTSYFPDPFSNTGTTYQYQSIGDWWWIWGAGPDGDYDIVPLQEAPNYLNFPVEIVNWTYDPTNGTVSDGDIWRMNQ